MDIDDKTIPHTPGPLIVREQGDADEFCLVTPDGKWFLGLRHNGEMIPAKQRVNLARLAQCFNACEGMRDPAAEIASLRNALTYVSGKISSYHDADREDARAAILSDIEHRLDGVLAGAL